MSRETFLDVCQTGARVWPPLFQGCRILGLHPTKERRRSLAGRLPEQANFEEIGPENDLADFISVYLTNPYSGNMAEPQQTMLHSPPGRQKSQDFLYLPWADRCEP